MMCNLPTPLTRARLDRGWTLLDVESRTGIHRGHLSRIERARVYPGKAHLERLLVLFPELTSDQILFPDRAAS